MESSRIQYFSFTLESAQLQTHIKIFPEIWENNYRITYNISFKLACALFSFLKNMGSIRILFLLGQKCEFFINKIIFTKASQTEMKTT